MARCDKRDSPSYGQVFDPRGKVWLRIRHSLYLRRRFGCAYVGQMGRSRGWTLLIYEPEKTPRCILSLERGVHVLRADRVISK